MKQLVIQKIQIYLKFQNFLKDFYAVKLIWVTMKKMKKFRKKKKASRKKSS